MSKHIAQIAPRRASNALIRELLHQVATIDQPAAAYIADTHLKSTLAQVLDGRWHVVLSDDAFHATYLASINVLVEHTARREGRPPMIKVEYDLLCHCVITCETLRQVIERTIAFLTMLGGRGAVATLRRRDDFAEFTLMTEHRQRDRIAMFSDLAGLAASYRLFAWLIDLPFDLIEVRMCYPELISVEAASFLIPVPIVYDAEETLFRFRADLLDRPVVRTPQQLNRLLARFPFDVDDTRGSKVLLTDRVRSMMLGTISSSEKMQSEHQMAEALGVSLATLKRRLKAENTSFREIREALLRTMAIDALRSDHTSVDVLARRLGFGDTASFRHAFKRWTGHPPSHYQKSVRLHSVPS